MLEQMKADRDAGLDLSKPSLGDYLRGWLDESARPTVSANTLRGYEDALIHLGPILSTPLERLTGPAFERDNGSSSTGLRGRWARPPRSSLDTSVRR